MTRPNHKAVVLGLSLLAAGGGGLFVWLGSGRAPGVGADRKVPTVEEPAQAQVTQTTPASTKGQQSQVVPPAPSATLQPVQTAGATAKVSPVQIPAQASKAPTAAIPLQDPSPRALLIAGQTKDLDYKTRLQEVEGLKGVLTAEDAALYTSYLDDAATDKGGDMKELYLKDLLLKTLIAQDPPDATLGRLMASMASNVAHDLRWRDYVVQHIPEYLERRAALGQPEDKEETAQIRKAVDSALQETGTVMPGTALIAMGRLVPGGLYNKEEVAKRSAEYLAQVAPGDPSRITAIQTSAQALPPGAPLDVYKRLAEDKAAPMLERMSAVAVLGQRGGAAELGFLSVLHAEGDSRLRTAAAASMATITRGTTK